MEELEIKKPEKLLTPIANYWNAIFTNHLLDMIHLHL